VGWPSPPTPEKHLQVLKASCTSVLAIDTQTDQVVGFVNAISDGIMAAYLPLLEVLPEYQKRGIGRELLQRILAELGDLYMVDLMTDTHLVGLYEKFGFRLGVGMYIRNMGRQACG
ncbi:MAG: GNAT family N-acetyltransferase, partial [candidate division Zixibacteria bacterium]|nr:GNAT family N-acetyltransferase [candidate division Zixibacteria bacterium]